MMMAKGIEIGIFIKMKDEEEKKNRSRGFFSTNAIKGITRANKRRK